MSQSHPGESDDHGELDPLLAFNAEFAAAESSDRVSRVSAHLEPLSR